MAFEPASFIIGPVSHGAARVLAIGVGAYALATGAHTWSAFRRRLPDRGSAMLATLVMAALTVLLWRDGARLLPAPFSLTALGIYMAGVLITFGYTLSNAAKRLEQAKEAMGKALDEWAARTLPEERREAWLRDRLRLELGDEERRKTPHLMMGLFIVGYLGLGALILKGIRAAAPASADLQSEGWMNVQIALDSGWLGASHMVALVALLGVLFLLLPVEMVRLASPELDYPFKGTINSLMRERERGLFGAHYYITATLPLAVLWLAADPGTWDRTLYAVIAVLGITVFADAASALFGVRFGRRKLPHNPGKTIVGTLGGTAVAFLIALPLTGLPVAIASAAVFFLVDVLAPVPFSASDNILNPLGLALTYLWLTEHLDPMLPYY